MVDPPRPESPRRSPALVSVVAPVYNERESIARFHQAVAAALEGRAFELVLVDDGSDDGTANLLDDIAHSDDRVRLVRLSRNFGHQAALTAGIDHAAGDVVVSMDSDLQDPPAVIIDLLAEWEAGSDVVYAVREQREGETRFKVASARWFYAIFARLAGISLENSGDFRLLDRQAVDALRRMPERNRFLRGMTVWVGFRQSAVPYTRDARHAGETHFTLRRMLRFSADAVSSFSHVPLQAATVLGFLFSAIAFLGIPFAIISRFAGLFVPGIASVLLVVFLLGGIQLITVGIIGEYVGRIYDEVKGRPLYIVAEADAGQPRAAGPPRPPADERRP
ncbi:MAG: glycosyltransferase family 2 protein [Solirubrobacterales bacterium]